MGLQLKNALSDPTKGSTLFGLTLRLSFSSVITWKLSNRPEMVFCSELYELNVEIF